MDYALIRYDAMVLAIAECHEVDEVKDLRDKAVALEMYYKQARNTEAERKAADIRLRAERRAGELLSELARATPQTANLSGIKNPSGIVADGLTPYRQALDRTGIPPRTATQYQQLANIPAEDFEQALADPVSKPTTRGLIREIRNQEPHVEPDALWLWGRARDFERDVFWSKNPVDLLDGMTDTMRTDMARIVPLMTAFFINFQGVLNDDSRRSIANAA